MLSVLTLDSINDRMNMNEEQLEEWELAGKSKYSEETYPSPISSTTNPIWYDLGLNPGVVWVQKLPKVHAVTMSDF
jgi:hypothetical protein